MGPDMGRVCEHTGLSTFEVIRLHTGAEFTVFAVGFVPGFPYLGYLPPELAGIPRLSTPRVRVEPGSIGVTGSQTGIYPLPRPAGGTSSAARRSRSWTWRVDIFPLQVGNRIRFTRIDEARLSGTGRREARLVSEGRSIQSW